MTCHAITRYIFSLEYFKVEHGIFTSLMQCMYYFVDKSGSSLKTNRAAKFIRNYNITHKIAKCGKNCFKLETLIANVSFSAGCRWFSEVLEKTR